MGEERSLTDIRVSLRFSMQSSIIAQSAATFCVCVRGRERVNGSTCTARGSLAVTE